MCVTTFFITEKSRGNVSNAAMVESYMNVFSSEDGDMRTSESDLQVDECEPCSPEVERTYQQVLNLMEVQKKLQTAPTVLQENYERLQSLGLEILESVKDLEQSSSNVLKSTES